MENNSVAANILPKPAWVSGSFIARDAHALEKELRHAQQNRSLLNEEQEWLNHWTSYQRSTES